MSALPDMEPIELLFALGLGPWLTPLHGKVPILDAWPTMPPVDQQRVEDWISTGANLGFRTGSLRLIVLDDDQARNDVPEATRYRLPSTGLVAESPTGGTHAYLVVPEGWIVPGNSASKLAPYVDVRGTGGQVVVPPSIHPNTGTAYRWRTLGEPGVASEDLLRAIGARRIDEAPPAAPAPARVPSGASYAQTALLRESSAVRSAPEGTRNDTLNRAAFNLGQLAAGGALDAGEVESELLASAKLAGLDEREAVRTIASGMKAGAEKPRSAPQRTAVASRPAPAQLVSPDDRPHVLVPGSHALPKSRALRSELGEYREQGAHTFAAEVLAAIPGETLYRRAGQLGEIHGAMFVPVTVDRLRSIIDAGVRLVAGKAPKADDEEGEPTIVYRPCSRDLASIVLAFGATNGEVRNLQFVASHPVFVGNDFTLAKPGWNEASGVFQACSITVPTMPLDEARAVLADMLVDFPFASAADFENMIGLLLTPLVRPAIATNVPMHLVAAPIARSGKSKLVELVLGITITGAKVPAESLHEREEEREKRIFSALREGQTIMHLDNLRAFIDSAILASLLTAASMRCRVLGQSVSQTVPNGMCVAATGNNVHMTGEIAKRVVPIGLSPIANPEMRQDFRHPDLEAFLFEHRARHLGACVALIQHWIAVGRPLHKAAFGGFERWTAVVGGIMHAAGYTAWLTNRREWQGKSDDETNEDEALVAGWYEAHQSNWVASSLIFDLAAGLELFGWVTAGKDDRGGRTAFGRRVISRLEGRAFLVSGGTLAVRVRGEGTGKSRRVRLEHD